MKITINLKNNNKEKEGIKTDLTTLKKVVQEESKKKKTKNKQNQA